MKLPESLYKNFQPLTAKVLCALASKVDSVDDLTQEVDVSALLSSDELKGLSVRNKKALEAKFHSGAFDDLSSEQIAICDMAHEISEAQVSFEANGGFSMCPVARSAESHKSKPIIKVVFNRHLIQDMLG